MYYNNYNISHGEYSHTNISSSDQRLNVWESDFIESLGKFATLSPKQESKLRMIEQKLNDM